MCLVPAAGAAFALTGEAAGHFLVQEALPDDFVAFLVAKFGFLMAFFDLIDEVVELLVLAAFYGLRLVCVFDIFRLILNYTIVFSYLTNI